MTQLSKLFLIFVPSSREKDDRHRGELKALTRWRICKIHCYKGKRLEVASPVVYIYVATRLRGQFTYTYRCGLISFFYNGYCRTFQQRMLRRLTLCVLIRVEYHYLIYEL